MSRTAAEASFIEHRHQGFVIITDLSDMSNKSNAVEAVLYAVAKDSVERDTSASTLISRWIQRAVAERTSQ